WYEPAYDKGSFTNVAAYLFQNDDVRKLMDWDARNWSRGVIIGLDHTNGIISTNPDIRVPYVHASTINAKLAQAKLITANSDKGNILRDFSKTIGFGDMTHNLWFLRKGDEIAGTVMNKNVIVIGSWGDSPSTRRLGELIEAMYLMRTKTKGSSVGKWDKWLPRIFPNHMLQFNRSHSVVKNLVNQLNY
ncbi:MAG: hypothetical protein ACFFC6_17020, partial [Promethearchaeota archaeon]